MAGWSSGSTSDMRTLSRVLQVGASPGATTLPDAIEDEFAVRSKDVVVLGAREYGCNRSGIENDSDGAMVHCLLELAALLVLGSCWMTLKGVESEASKVAMFLSQMVTGGGELNRRFTTTRSIKPDSSHGAQLSRIVLFNHKNTRCAERQPCLNIP